MTQHANDEALHTPSSAVLPPSPFNTTRKPLEPAARVSIDLTNSPEQPKAQENDIKSQRARILARPLQSADEKRLTGDFHTPSDRVVAPDPHLAFAQQNHSVMTRAKPGSENAFKPVNSLNSVGTRNSSHKAVTYGRHDRHSNLIGKTKGTGQRRYDQRHDKNPKVSPGKLGVGEGNSRHAATRPQDHRKEVIALDDDDDLQEVSPHFVPTRTDAQNTPVREPSQLLQSHSGTGYTASNVHPPAIQTSEFMQTDNAIVPRRRRPKIPTYSNGHGHVPPARWITGRRSGSQGTVEAINNQDSPSPSKSGRSAILGEIEQGKSGEKTIQNRQHGNEGTHKFRALGPRACINENTAFDRSLNISQGDEIESPDLQESRPAENNAQIESSSEDELAMDTARPKARKHPASKTATTEGNLNFKPGYQPLVFARTHGFEYRLADASGQQPPHLVLRHHGQQQWQVLEYNNESNTYEIRMLVDLHHVTRMFSDEITRIRLDGPYKNEQRATYLYDLSFADASHCQIFRDKCKAVVPRTYVKSEQHMELLFKVALKEKGKKGSTMDNAKLVLTEGQDPSTSTSKPIGSLQGEHQQAPQADDSTIASLLKAISRPVRSTRASAPKHDEDGDLSAEEVEKYSITTGLGPAWKRPLTYGEGRRRATVYFEDLKRLDEGEWLNDSLIDFYIIYLYELHKVPKDKIFFFNTYLFKKLTADADRGGINYKAVERWTAKVDIFSYDYLVVPIHDSDHWYLAIICNVGNIDRKPVTEDMEDDTAPVEVDDLQLPNDGYNVEGFISKPRDSSPFNSGSGSLEQTIVAEPEIIESELSNVNVIDPEYNGSHLAVQSASDVPNPSSDAAVTGNGESQNTSVSELPTTTVLSNLRAPAPRKKQKRKSVVSKRDPDLPVIMILDSLGITRTSAVRALKDWIAAEGHSKRGMEAVIKEKGVYPKELQIPNQKNAVDCGVYILGYVDKFFQDPDTFKQRLLTGEMSAEDDWPDLQPKNMRSNLRNIIFKLADEQELTVDTKRKKKKAMTVAPAMKAPSNATDQKATSLFPDASNPTRGDTSQASTTKQEPSPRRSPSLDKKPQDLGRSPRLGSPFQPMSTPRSGSPDVVRKVSNPAPISPVLHAASMKKRSPEVRITVQSPHTQISPRRSSVDGSDMASKRSISPIKRRVDEALLEQRGPLRKKRMQAAGLPAENKRVSTRSNMAGERQHLGNKDDPIEIESQSKSTASASFDAGEVEFLSETAIAQSPHTAENAPRRIHDATSSPSSRHRQSVQSGTAEEPVTLLPDVQLDVASNSMQIDSPEGVPISAGTEDIEMREADDTIEETPEPGRRSPPLHNGCV